ncbi:MAG: hypothetical protein ACRDPR_14500, partial [Nocardioidaceae bacterium]
LLDGLDQLRAGLVKVDNGLRDLSKGVGGIRNNPKYQALLDGLDTMLAGIGSTGDPGTLTWGVNEVREGLETNAVPGIQRMKDGVHLLSATDPGAYEKLGCALVILNDIQNGTLPAPLGTGRFGGTDNCYRSAANPTGQIPPLIKSDPPATTNQALWTPDNFKFVVLGSLITQLGEGRNDLFNPGNEFDADTLFGGLNLLQAGLTSVDPSDPGALLALSSIQCGLDNTSLAGGDSTLGLGCAQLRPGQPGLRQGLTQVAEGVPTLVNTIIATVQGAIGNAADVPADKTLRGGMSGLIDGTDLLSDGGADLIEGLGLLSEGAGQLSDGSGELADGLGELEAGAGQLADGTGRAADGAGQVADGAGQLADGLKDAANGTSRLSDGLGKAAAGAPKLEDGAQRLSDEGTKKLVEAGEATAQNYGEMYAVIEAGAERADAEKMAYGAPADAQGLTAYTYEMLGDDGESGRNTKRGLMALGLLALGGGALLLRRRFI